jgi:glycosyltransferase involved in cell wall biosynthesis
MGKSGRRIAEERFSIEKMAAAYAELYRLAAPDGD